MTNPTPTTYTYDLTTYDGSGNVTHQGLGNLLTVTTPGNNAAQAITITFGYTQDGGYSQMAAIGQPLTVMDNLGKVSHLRYDSRGNALSVMDALGNKTDLAYNIADQPLQTISPATGQQGAGRSSSVSAYLYPGGPLTGTTAYDESGTALRQVNYAYGTEGETLGVSGSTEPVTYAYDALYRLSTLTDGNGNATHYYYKQQGYLDAVTYPGYTGPAPVYNSTTDGYANITGADSLRYPSYDADGNLLTRVDGNGVETDYTHSADPQSLLTLVHYVYPSGYSGGTTGDVSLAYDAYGRRAGMTDGTGSQSYAYDDGDAPLTNSTTYTNVPAQSITYGYYPNGSRQSMSTPAGSFSYSYDAVGRMAGLTNPYGEASSWQYLDNGWLWKQTLGNNAVTARTYNAVGETTDLQTRTGGGAVLSDFGSMGYNGVGDRLSLTASLAGASSGYSGTTAYQYDIRSQVTQEQSTRGGNPTNTFGYDGGVGTGPGNPTSFRGTSHSFNADNQDTANTYDGNGNPVTYNGQSRSFDPENRLLTSTMTRYTGDGLRACKPYIQQEVPINDGPVSGTTKSGSGQASFTPMPSALTLTYFLYDGSEPVCELRSDNGSVTAVNTFGANGLLSRHTGSGSVFYTCDASGNVAQRLDGSGAVVSSDLYGGFGAVQNGGGNPFGFGGQWGGYTETGLVLMTHRFYDPTAGRFITRDPIGYRGGVNLYAYTGNNPVNRVDPSGYWWGIDPIVGGIVGGVIVVAVLGTLPITGPILAAGGAGAVLLGIGGGAFGGAIVGGITGGIQQFTGVPGASAGGGALLGMGSGAVAGGLMGAFPGTFFPPRGPRPPTTPTEPDRPSWPPAPTRPPGYPGNPTFCPVEL